ncbi:MAG: IS110 family transposase [Nitrospirae bacterium]|nr:IS110 family transposase [Nitrospirota bacterium]
MRFYTKTHKFYCGIDLHAKSMYLCIINQEGEILLHRNIRTNPEVFLKTIAPYREDIVVAVECLFLWYWLADLCTQENIPFVLGHALYMKAIHGGKAKNDKIDAHKIAVLLRGGMIPMAYVYPQEMRSTRDLLRRRTHLVRKRAELLAHVQNTNYQYNLPDIGKKIAYKANREGVAERFPDEAVQKSIQLDLSLLNFYNPLLLRLEHELSLTAKVHDADSYFRIRSIPGIGRVLGMTILYEIHDINRFSRVQDFVSYCRLVKSAKESSGKYMGTSGKKIGNVHLKWAFSEAAVLFLRRNPQARKYRDKLMRKHGKAKSMTILAHKLARAIYYILKRKEVFHPVTFFAK